MYLIFSCSLNENSKSNLMAKHALSLYPKGGKIIDLRKLDIPFCDGGKCYDESIVTELKNNILAAKSIIIAGPIYNYDLNAAAKNLIELTGRAWTDKVVGFICAAGGKGSYMSPMSFANSLMLDFRCLIIPRFIYADGSYFNNNNLDETIKDRIKDLVEQSILLSDNIDI